MAKIKIHPSTLRAYCRRKVKCAARYKTKFVDLVCESLAIDGYPKPEGIGSHAWINQNVEVIMAGRLKKMPPKPPKQAKLKKPKIAGNEFLFSYEWRRLRMEAIKLYGARCQCCGASPATGAVINVDHIKPRLKYPELALDINNLQILCGACNHGKGNWDETDWR